MKTQFIIILICFGLTASGATPSPLAAFSSQWNYPMFEKANTAANANFLNEEEKEFIYILNLARMNPYLFSETVLKPFAKNNGYSFQIVNMMDQMKYARPAKLLSVHEFQKQDINNWIDAIQKIKNENPTLIFQKTKLKNAVYFISSATNTVALFCNMIADANAGVHSLRNLVLSDNNTICISIKKEKGFITAINFDERTPNQLDKCQRELEIEKLVEIESHKRQLNYSDCPEDSIFKFFLKDENIDIGNAVFVSSKKYEKIKDSLFALKIDMNVFNQTAFIEIIKSIPKKKNEIPSYEYYVWDLSNSTTSSRAYETEKPIHYFSLSRTLPDSANEQSKVIYREIKTHPTMLGQFPIDSIGIKPIEIDYDKVDNFSKSVGTFPLKQLAIKLTKPWKSESEKVRAIFKWMDYNLKYDYQGLTSGQPTFKPDKVLEKKVAICQGYAELFSALCNVVGIRNEMIIGVVKKSSGKLEGHAWNAVCIDKKWYLVDVTWGEDFYLSTPEYFYKDHFPSENRWTLLPEFHSSKEFKNNKYVN